MIEYSKPYKSARGKRAKYKLNDKHIPAYLLPLHKRIIDARDQIHAHTDLTVLEAKIYVQNTSYGKSVNISQNVIYGTQEISNIDEIINLIEKTLDSMYEEEKLLREQLPLNS